VKKYLLEFFQFLAGFAVILVLAFIVLQLAG